MPYKKDNNNTALNDAIRSIAKDLEPVVSAIEASTPMTQHHYGRYMDILSRFGDDLNTKRLAALALLDAGANAMGVKAAMKIHGI